jgi:paraquat-inducible protein B
MQFNVKNITRVSAIALALGLASGCTTITQEQLDAVAATANNALSEARSAASQANNALGVANEAAAAAQQAQQTADAALACCNENRDRMDRMFQEGMRK